MEEKLKIINRVTDSFHLNGAKTVTMDEVAQICGISKKTLYQHFPNKESLLNHIVDHTKIEIEKLIFSIRELNLNPIEELLTIHTNIQKILKSENDVFMYQLMKYYPKIHEKCYQSKFETAYNFIYSNIENGIKQKIYKPEINPEIISKMFFTISVSIKSSDLFQKMEITPKEIKKSVLQFFLYGLMTDKGFKIYNNYNSQYEI